MMTGRSPNSRARRSGGVRRGLTALLGAFALAVLSGCSSPPPATSDDDAHRRLEAFFADTAAAVSPKVQWTAGAYEIEADRTGFCGTQGCDKSGRASLGGTYWVKTRVAKEKSGLFRDQLTRHWAGQGLRVESRPAAGELVVRDSQHAVRLVWLGGEVGCFRLESSLGNVGDATKPDDTVGYPFGRPVEGEQACGTVDDPYWSH